MVETLPTRPGDYRGRRYLWQLDELGWWDTAGFSFEPTDQYVAADAPFERLVLEKDYSVRIGRAAAAWDQAERLNGGNNPLVTMLIGKVRAALSGGEA